MCTIGYTWMERVGCRVDAENDILKEVTRQRPALLVE